MLVLALAACRKERTCVCTQAQTDTAEVHTDSTATTTYKKITKIKAKRLCNKMADSYHASTYYNNGGTSITNYANAYDCELK